MTTPFILINFKSYREGAGNNAGRIAEAAEMIMQESGVRIGVAPQFVELHPFCKHYEIPVYAQHIDAVEVRSPAISRHSPYVQPDVPERSSTIRNAA